MCDQLRLIHIYGTPWVSTDANCLICLVTYALCSIVFILSSVVFILYFDRCFDYVQLLYAVVFKVCSVLWRYYQCIFPDIFKNTSHSLLLISKENRKKLKNYQKRWCYFYWNVIILTYVFLLVLFKNMYRHVALSFTLFIFVFLMGICGTKKKIQIQKQKQWSSELNIYS